MRSTTSPEIHKEYFSKQKLLTPDHPLYIPKAIARERRFVVACNYAYDVEGESPVPDYIYEYAVSNLELYEKYCQEEWNECKVFYGYYVLNEDWKYTGSGVPQTEDAKKLADYLRKKWRK